MKEKTIEELANETQLIQSGTELFRSWADCETQTIPKTERLPKVIIK